MVIHNLVFLVYLILNAMQQLLPDDVNDGNIIEQNNQDNFPATDSRHHTLNGSSGNDYSNFRKATRELASVRFQLEKLEGLLCFKRLPRTLRVKINIEDEREKIGLNHQAERQTLLTAITLAKINVASVEDRWNQLFSGRSEELKNYWNNSLNGLLRSYRGNLAKQFPNAKKEDASK